MKIYPRRWRERYEVEFLAVLEYQKLTFRIVIDIILGACDAHCLAWQCKGKGGLMRAPTQHHEVRIVLVLLAGVLLVFRSMLQSVVLILGVDVLALVGVVFLIVGFVLAYRLRKLRPGLA
jgi:hypothetical protein